MPFCINCGREYPAGKNFCRHCGAQLPPMEQNNLPFQNAAPLSAYPQPAAPQQWTTPAPQPRFASPPKNPTFYLDPEWAAGRKQAPVGWIVLLVLWLILALIFYIQAQDAPLKDRSGYLAACWVSVGLGFMHVWGIIEFYRNKSVYDSIRVEILPDGINLYCVEKKLISRISIYRIDWKNIHKVLIGENGMLEIHFYDNYQCINRVIPDIPIEKPAECAGIIRQKAGIQ
ncbi:MAG: zinc ribbon domain-containing protein [Oscillospiraceae bacterium]|nr:zinc ribbon domain-containing protein [Oscillospiraceae bacterium]